MPESVKVASFSNEVIRRLKTSSVDIELKEMERILMDLMDDLFPMEYTKERKGKVLRSEIVGCLRLLDRVAKEKPPG